MTNAFLVSVCIAIFVCCLAIQAATTRLLYAYGRDKMVPGSRVFGYVHPRTKTPMASAIIISLATIAVLLYVNTSGNPALTIARVTAWATAGTYVAYQMVVIGAIIARSKGWPKDKAYFTLGKWGWPVNFIALFYGVFMIINLSWPRTPTAKWYDNYIVVVSISTVLVVGVIVYIVQRARGVDLSATIHEIGESPADAGAALAMAAGEAGKVLPGEPGISEMSGPQRPGGPEGFDG